MVVILFCINVATPSVFCVSSTMVCDCTELEVRSSYALYSPKTKSSRCHYVISLMFACLFGA